MENIDPDKARQLLEWLEAEDARVRAERIEAGELVSLALSVIVGTESQLAAAVEQAKTNKLAELRAAGETREVVFDVTMVVTGVLRDGEAPGSEPWKPRPRLPSPAPPAPDEVEEEAQPEPQPPLIESYITVQVRQCQDENDPGEIIEAWYSVNDRYVTVTDAKGREIGSRAMVEGEDARVVAKLLLRGKKAPEDEFNRPLSYPNAGLA